MCSFLMSYSVFFFKQKTAYEMRISDWSSDVCSSDLQAVPEAAKYASLLHAICCNQRHNLRGCIRRGNDKPGDFLPFADRRLDRAVINKLDRYIGARRARQSNGEILGRHKSNFSIATKLDGHLVNHLPLFEQRLRLPCLESPIHESDRFPDTAIITLKPRQDHDKPATNTFSRTSERSEERREGKECVRKVKLWWLPSPKT